MLFLVWLIWALNFLMVSADVSSAPPVLIWGIKTPETKTIFRTVKSKQFYGLMKKIQKKYMIVMYFASELAAKDINCAPCFPNLQLIKPMNYYSQVDEPLKALKHLSKRTKKIIWHKPKIINQTQVRMIMRVPCQPGQIHAFNFNDRNLIAHDLAMSESNTLLSGCRAVQAYTALAEENLSLLRRQNQSIKMRVPIYFDHKVDSNDSAPHVSYFNTSNNSTLTVLRHERAILAFDHILVATKDPIAGKSSPIIRWNVSVVKSEWTMQVGIYTSPDLDAAFDIILDTTFGSLVIEVLPIKGNWLLSRVILNETIFYSTDLIYFCPDFSLCCSDVTFFAKNRSLLTLFEFYMDIVNSRQGRVKTYEAKPCWSCSQFVSPTLTQTLVVMFLFVAFLGVGVTFITNVGRNELVQVANEPDLYIKSDQ
ncbi:hypothetical protein KR054_005022 [Drosophila jambulina]|nr:hypothetical protein KR054_005022 [Drosophila jambulina]